jgi:hypothetical protein
MKAMSVIFFLFVMGVTIGCSAVYDVQYDYDTMVDFGGFKTYNWMKIPEKPDINNLDVERIKKAVNGILPVKGLRKTIEDPDFLIAVHLAQKDKLRVTNWGYSYGPHAGYWGHGGVSIYQYEEGSLILDFVDAASEKLIWRGAAKADINAVRTPDKREKLLNEAVQKILENFPPPSSNFSK